MPRYKYPALRPRIQRWAAQQGVQYRESGEWEMLAGNYQNYARVATQLVDPNAPVGRKGTTI